MATHALIFFQLRFALTAEAMTWRRALKFLATTQARTHGGLVTDHWSLAPFRLGDCGAGSECHIANGR